MSILFYTTANKEYEYFVPLYIYFVLRSNPEAFVEIGLEDAELYKSKNSQAINILHEKFGEKFKLSSVNFEGVLPGAVRFITEPTLAQDFDYVYIGDIDILIMDNNIQKIHTENMAENDAPFSNIIRGTQNDRLSGLHFAPTNLQYPLNITKEVDVSAENNTLGADERALYNIMKNKGAMIPKDLNFRPTHGIHTRTHNHPFGLRSGLFGPKFSFKEIHNGNQKLAWCGIEDPQYRNSFTEVLQEKYFQKLFFHLDIRAKNIVFILENICANRFDSYENEMHQYISGKFINKMLIRRKLSYTIVGDIYKYLRND